MSRPTAHPAGRVAYRGPRGVIYLNITNRCSSSCEFCLRGWSNGVYGESLALDVEPEPEDVTAAIEMEFLNGPAEEVVFCGFGEPTMRLDVVLAVTEWLHLRRIRARMDTNGHGQLLNPGIDVATTLAAAGLTAVSVSLNAADPVSYDDLCRPIFSKAHRAVIVFAEECIRHGIQTALSVVEYPRVDVPGCEAIARTIGAGFRVRALVTPEDEGKGGTI